MPDHPIQEYDERLIEKFQKAKQRIIRNRLIMITIINIATFFTMILAMLYYQWMWVDFVVKKNQFD